MLLSRVQVQTGMNEGERIRRIREALGLTRKYVAIEAGLSPSMMTRIEQGKPGLTYRRAVRLAGVLHCSILHFDEVLGRPIAEVIARILGGRGVVPATSTERATKDTLMHDRQGDGALPHNAW